MNKVTRYVCIEGCDGVGKTTQTQLLVDFLRQQGYSVLQTKEPGTDHLPLTMELRKIMLSNEYDGEMTRLAREFMSQAIRSIHLEKLVVPAMSQYDFIVQDRGILSGYAYGTACGNDFHLLHKLASEVVGDALNSDSVVDGIYDAVIYLRGDSLRGLARARDAKQEFAAGDAMESRGDGFMAQVAAYMDGMCRNFNTIKIDVDGKSVDEVHSEILSGLGLEKR